MNTDENASRPIRQVHINRFNQAANEVESGWEVSVRDAETGTVVPVFIPDNLYGTDQAKALIQFELDKVRGVHGLRF